MEEVHGIFYELQICELYPEYFLSATGLAQQGCLKKTEVDIELLTDVDVLLMVEKSIRVGSVHAIYHYGKANKKVHERLWPKQRIFILMYWGVKNFYGWAMSQTLSMVGLK